MDYVNVKNYGVTPDTKASASREPTRRQVFILGFLSGTFFMGLIWQITMHLL